MIETAHEECDGKFVEKATQFVIGAFVNGIIPNVMKKPLVVRLEFIESARIHVSASQIVEKRWQ
eukprot:4601278-Amphidinium_carterae.1